MEPDLLTLLARNKLVKGLTKAQIRRMADQVRVETFPAGTVIVRQAESPDRVHLLANGLVQVRRQMQGFEDSEIAELEAGDFFGEMAVIAGAVARSASVIATTAVTTFSLPAADFLRFIHDSPGATRNILLNIIIQLQTQNDKWLEVVRAEKQVLEWKVRERTQELEQAGERVRRELMLAQSIQRNLLPEKRKSFPGIAVATEYIPCEELGGDITGVFQVDETRIAVYGGDVCGHGVYAAMVMSYVKKLIETSVKRVLLNRQYVVKPPGAVLTTINQSFISEISQGDPEIYLTLFLGVLDIRRLDFEYSSAGIHVPPVVLSGGKALELFTQSDFAIGHVAGHEYVTSRRTFSPGDAFLFASDGVVEARRDHETFGLDRLKDDAVRIQRESGSLDIDLVVGSIRAFLGSESPQDDMCMLTMAFHQPNELPK